LGTLLARYQPRFGDVVHGWQKPPDFDDKYLREPALVHGVYTHPHKLLTEIDGRKNDPAAPRNRLCVMRMLPMTDADFWQQVGQHYHVSLSPRSLYDEVDD